jgi:hypothetical protein
MPRSSAEKITPDLAGLESNSYGIQLRATNSLMDFAFPAATPNRVNTLLC